MKGTMFMLGELFYTKQHQNLKLKQVDSVQSEVKETERIIMQTSHLTTGEYPYTLSSWKKYQSK